MTIPKSADVIVVRSVGDRARPSLSCIQRLTRPRIQGIVSVSANGGLSGAVGAFLLTRIPDPVEPHRTISALSFRPDRSWLGRVTRGVCAPALDFDKVIEVLLIIVLWRHLRVHSKQHALIR